MKKGKQVGAVMVHPPDKGRNSILTTQCQPEKNSPLCFHQTALIK